MKDNETKQYLVDYEELAKFVDSLIAEKYPGHPAEVYSNLRENMIEEVDDYVATELFGNLTDAELVELNQVLDTAEEPSVFQSFFDKQGIDFRQKVADAMAVYGRKFLGGQNE